MWKFRYTEEYLPCVEDLLRHPAVRAMERLPQHTRGFSCLHHSVLVSYWSWRIAVVLGMDARAAARGGLLHDLYLYDWTCQRPSNGKWHGTEHPREALRNARALFSLSWKEEDIIVKHMWPLTRPFYRCWEAFLVSCVDKGCAIAELLRAVPDPAAFYGTGEDFAERERQPAA